MNATVTMLDTIVPKSDQLNADCLIGGPRTITLTKVSLTGEEQPVALHFEGDEGKPYKPGKSMRRVLVHAWGPDANKYIGRSMTVYCDPAVVFGGAKVGGIRISHMSNIECDMTVALTVTRANRKPFTVKPLRAPAQRAQRPAAQNGGFPGDRPQSDSAPALTLPQRADAYERRLKEATGTVKLHSIHKAAAQLLTDLEGGDPERKVELDQLFEDRLAILDDAERSDQ